MKIVGILLILFGIAYSGYLSFSSWDLSRWGLLVEHWDGYLLVIGSVSMGALFLRDS